MDLTNLNKDRKQRKNGNPLEVNPMLYGKIPPQSRELEEAILGAIMLEKAAFDIVAEILKPDSFYVDANQRVFNAMMVLQQKNFPIDMLTVIEQLRFSQELDMVGGPYYVTRLTNSVNSSAHIESHCRIVQQKFIQREIIRIGGEMVMMAFEDSTDVFELLDHVETNVYAIANSHLRSDYTLIDKVMAEEIGKIEILREKNETVTGVPSGYPQLDKITHGWQDTDLIILAARPSVGKTAYALNLARNAAMDKVKPVPVGFFSLEMSKGQLVRRIMSLESKIPLENITTGNMEDYQMVQLYEKGIYPLGKSKIYIDDQAAINIMELRAKARRMKAKHGVGLIIVDYLQLMGSESNKSGNREQEISKISRNLKGLAKEIAIPIIALSQLSREVEKRKEGNKQPVLSDLRESGAIEQDADLVMFLYKPDEFEEEKDPELRGMGNVKIAKHRNGKLESFVFRIMNEIQTWDEVSVLAKKWKPVATADHFFEKQYTPKSSMAIEETPPGDPEDLPF